MDTKRPGLRPVASRSFRGATPREQGVGWIWNQDRQHLGSSRCRGRRARSFVSLSSLRRPMPAGASLVRSCSVMTDGFRPRSLRRLSSRASWPRGTTSCSPGRRPRQLSAGWFASSTRPGASRSRPRIIRRHTTGSSSFNERAWCRAHRRATRCSIAGRSATSAG